MKRYQVESYVTEDGEAPIQLWLEQLKDRTAQTKIYARLDRASYGNFGDWKKLKDVKEIFEMREHYGQGYRLYYTIVGQTIVLLLAGSSKQDQNRQSRRHRTIWPIINGGQNHDCTQQAI